MNRHGPIAAAMLSAAMASQQKSPPYPELRGSIGKATAVCREQRFRATTFQYLSARHSG